MPLFTYTGRANRLVISGRTLIRGRATELDGRAADSAAAHPDVVEGEPASEASSPPDISTLDEAPQTGDELRVTLGGATIAQLSEFAAEHDIDLDELGSRPKHADLVEAIAEALEADAGAGGS